MLASVCGCHKLTIFYFTVIAEFRRGRRAAKRSTIYIILATEPSAFIEIENHKSVFSWSTWLAACTAGACSQRRRRRRRRTTWRPNYSQYQVMQPWFTAYIFGIGHPCYGQLTPVKTGYPLTSVT